MPSYEAESRTNLLPAQPSPPAGIFLGQGELPVLSDFSKVKIGFALGLLGTYFALWPLLEPVRGVGADVGPISLNVGHGLVGSASLLGLAVYAYSLLVFQKPWTRHALRIGDLCFMGAITWPPLAATIMLAMVAIRLASEAFLVLGRQPFLDILSVAVAVITAGVSFYLARKGSRTLQLFEHRSQELVLSRWEFERVRQVLQLRDEGAFGLCIIEAWQASRSVLTHLLRRLTNQSRKPLADELVETIAQHGAISSDLVEAVESLLELRRRVGTLSFIPQRSDADLAIKTMLEVFAAVRRSESGAED